MHFISFFGHRSIVNGSYHPEFNSKYARRLRHFYIVFYILLFFCHSQLSIILMWKILPQHKVFSVKYPFRLKLASLSNILANIIDFYWEDWNYTCFRHKTLSSSISLWSNLLFLLPLDFFVMRIKTVALFLDWHTRFSSFPCSRITVEFALWITSQPFILSKQSMTVCSD